jgi:spermidine/putrescine transport system permease protein
MRTYLPWIYLALAFGFIYLPVCVLVLFSFQDGGLPVPPFDGPSLKWYREVLSDRDVTDALIHSLFVAVGSSAVAVILGFLAAYGLARHTLPGSAFIRLLLVAPLTVSYLIVGLGLLIVLSRAGFGLSLGTAGIGHVVINLPLAFAIIYASMGAQHENAERAARDLGASEMRVVVLGDGTDVGASHRRGVFSYLSPCLGTSLSSRFCSPGLISHCRLKFGQCFGQAYHHALMLLAVWSFSFPSLQS